jgi:transposase
MQVRGRKTKLNAEVRERFLQAIRVGATYDLACKFAGITYQTFLNWKERAEKDGSGEFFEFFEDISKAEGLAAIKWLALLDKHADIDPKWAAWKLERRYPEQYGRQRVELTGKDGGAIILKTGMNMDDL